MIEAMSRTVLAHKAHKVVYADKVEGKLVAVMQLTQKITLT